MPGCHSIPRPTAVAPPATVASQTAPPLDAAQHHSSDGVGHITQAGQITAEAHQGGSA